MDTNRSHQELDTALQQALDFTRDDLEINKRGQLSQRQQLALGGLLDRAPQLNSGCRMGILIGMLLLLGLLILVLFAVAGDAMKVLFSNPISWAVVGSIVLIVLLISYFSGGVERRARRLIQKLKESPASAQVLNVKGSVRKITVRGGRRISSVHYLIIGGKSLQVQDRSKFDAFQEGIFYQVFFIDMVTVPYLVSAEVIDQP